MSESEPTKRVLILAGDTDGNLGDRAIVYSTCRELKRLCPGVSLTIASLGAHVTVYDPQAMERARQEHPQLNYAPSMGEAAQGADVVLLLTEWAEFKDADPEDLGKVVTERKIVDGRNALDPTYWRSSGWTYRALGRQ